MIQSVNLMLSGNKSGISGKLYSNPKKLCFNWRIEINLQFRFALPWYVYLCVSKYLKVRTHYSKTASLILFASQKIKN